MCGFISTSSGVMSRRLGAVSELVVIWVLPTTTGAANMAMTVVEVSVKTPPQKAWFTRPTLGVPTAVGHVVDPQLLADSPA